MKFEEAFKHLMTGGYVQREAWKKTGEYLVAMPGMPHVWKIITQPAPNPGNWMPLQDDFLAEDWSMGEKVDIEAIKPVA